MDAFFERENRDWPPSVASNAIMHQTSKSDLMECLDSVVPDVDVNIVDCAALVRIMDPTKSQVSVKTFHDYAQLVFLPYTERMLQDVVQIDVVWGTA